MKKTSNSTRNGASSAETTEPPRDSRSTKGASRSTSVTSAITPIPKTNQKASQATPNFQDAPNASRLIQALAGKLGGLVEWKRLTLGDGREVYALIFPTDKWHVDSESKELLPS